MVESKKDTVDLTHTCQFIHEQWTENYGTVSLEYTEHSTDHWHSDSVTSIDIDREMAQKIVTFLRSKFSIE